MSWASVLWPPSLQRLLNVLDNAAESSRVSDIFSDPLVSGICVQPSTYSLCEARRYLCLHVYFSVSGILNFSTPAIGGWTVLCSGGCPVHCSMCSGIPGLYPLDVITTLSPLRPTKMSPDIARCPLGLWLGGKPHTWLRTMAVYQTRGSSKAFGIPPCMSSGQHQVINESLWLAQNLRAD